jgi:hypothetical protein
MPADGMSAATKGDFGTSRWQLSDELNVRARHDTRFAGLSEARKPVPAGFDSSA